MSSSPLSELERLADALAEGAALELRLTPKPGLVDLLDCGSHPDLSLPIMERSLEIVAHYLRELTASLGRGEAFARQVAIGKGAEGRLRDELGTNTHKGYLFLSGLVLIARWQAGAADEGKLRAAIGSLARGHFAAPEAGLTHGERARRKFGSGGIVREASLGLPSLFEVALPAYGAAIDRYGSVRTASFAMLARLMQTVEDTTALHRCGQPGLERLRADGRKLETWIDQGRDALPFLEELNRDYVAMNLTMGGVADVLGLAYGWLIAGGQIQPALVRGPALSAGSGR